MGPSLLRLLAATVLATAAASQPALAMRDGAPGRAGAHAAFSKTASGVDRDFCQLRAPVDASQLAEPRRENGCIYGRSAKDITKDPNGYQDSVNQYAYGANDPINHRDPTGRRIDVSKVNATDLLALLTSIDVITGLNVSVSPSGELVASGGYAGPPTKHSSLAQNILLDAIDDPQVIAVESKNGEGYPMTFGSHPKELNYPGDTWPAKPKNRTGYEFAEGQIWMDFNDHAYQRGPADVLRASTVGLTFFHELLHTVVTGWHADGSDLGQWETLGDPERLSDPQPGAVETVLNRIRREMGLPRTTNYFAPKRNNERCQPFATGKLCWDVDKVDEPYAP